MALAFAGPLTSCGQGRADPPVDGLRHPTGLAITPDDRWLLITGGNWDLAQSGGAVWALDLAQLEQGILDPVDPGSRPGDGQACGRNEDDVGPMDCDAGALIDGRATVFLGTGAGNVGVDQPKTDGQLRLLIPVRDPASVTWIDVSIVAGQLTLECGQGEGRTCDPSHQIRRLNSNDDTAIPADPANILVDREARYAYVPHLIDGGLSLIALDGQAGPELTDIESGFFREDPFEDIEIAGGFAVARRICDPALPLAGSQDCERPYLFASQRYWPGTREFTVAPGLDVIQGRSETALLGFDAEQVELRPFMGDLEFEDPETGESLLIVHTTPAGISRVDTSLDDAGRPRSELRATVPVCRNPNMLDVVRIPGREALAFVSCYGDDEVAVVGLGSFKLVANIPVGDGPNELVEDLSRGWLYVANTQGNTISVIGVDPGRVGYLEEIARIGGG